MKSHHLVPSRTDAGNFVTRGAYITPPYGLRNDGPLITGACGGGGSGAGDAIPQRRRLWRGTSKQDARIAHNPGAGPVRSTFTGKRIARESDHADQREDCCKKAFHGHNSSSWPPFPNISNLVINATISQVRRALRLQTPANQPGRPRPARNNIGRPA